MNYYKYYELYGKGEITKAKEYKNSCMPKKLYKYYSLTDDEQLNQKKLDCLSKGKIYLSEFESFNDPFEGKFYHFDYKKLKEKKEIEQINRFYSEIKDFFRFTCLTDTNEQNMPMWAYYANNHTGYCIEYEFDVEQLSYIYPTLYEDRRINANPIIMGYMQSLYHSMKNKETVETLSSDTALFQELFITTFFSKHKSWGHEKEYRIIVPNDTYFDAIPKKIFIGKNCKKNHEEKLIEISNTLKSKCKVFKMCIDENNFDFELQLEEIKYQK